MAAGRSKFKSIRRGAMTGQGAKVLREGLAPLPSLQLYVPAIDTLEEICGWLGTFRERLRMAHIDERADVAAAVGQPGAPQPNRRGGASSGGGERAPVQNAGTRRGRPTPRQLRSPGAPRP